MNDALRDYQSVWDRKPILRAVYDDFYRRVPTLIATRDRDRFHRRFPNLKIERVDWFSLFVYPLSGGFKTWSLIPQNLAGGMLAMERRIEGSWGRFTAFRMMLIVEKRERAREPDGI